MSRRLLLVLAASLVLAGCNAGGRPQSGNTRPVAASTGPTSVYVVAPGDTVSTIARRQGVNTDALIAANGLTPPYVIYPGQHMIIPGGGTVPPSSTAVRPTPAPVGPASRPVATSVPPATRPASSPPSSGPASSGGNVQSPSRSGVEEEVLTSPSSVPQKPVANPSTPPATPGPVTTPISVPPAPSAGNPSTPATPGGSSPPPATTPTPPVVVPDTQATTPPASSVPASPTPSAPTASGGSGSFLWPVNGKVIAAFGPQKNGLKNDGINIAAPKGAPVRAAAAGTVIYAGNELKGFGNLLLIRHEGNWVTAYAHNDSLLVKRGEKVTRGQTVARVGQTGNVSSPQLHFELRKGTQTIDPVPQLGG